MNKIRKSIKAIYEIIRNPWLLNNVIADDSIWNGYLNSHYKLYNGLPVIQLDELFPDFSETINTFSFLDGGSLPTDIALLKLLCKKFENCNYFEIGTWRGESVANVSEVCRECYTLNLSKNEMMQRGAGEKYADLHGFFSKQISNINHLYGDSLQFDFHSLDKKFDVIFIDGNHHYDFVKNDTKNIFQHLLHERSIVVWHDYAINPEKVRPEVLAGILDGTELKYHKYLYHVANTLCAVFIRSEFNTSTLEPPVKPIKKFKLKLDPENL